MAEHKQEIEFVEVKSEDIMAERQAVYDAFMIGAAWATGATIVLLVVIYLIWG